MPSCTFIVICIYVQLQETVTVYVIKDLSIYNDSWSGVYVLATVLHHDTYDEHGGDDDITVRKISF